MKKLNYSIAVVLSALLNNATAQDFHLSQYDVARLYMNPALTGMYAHEKGDYKIYSDYRSQWRALGVKPYSTAYLAYDMPYERWEKKFGLGGYLINNRAGVGHYNTLNLMLAGAYDITKEGEHYLTTGLQMGFLYKSFNPNYYTYDVQYSPSQGGFDSNISNEEYFSKTSIFRFDANVGIYYKYMEIGSKVHPFMGFAIQHLTKPRESFYKLDQRQPMRFNGNLGADAQINDKLKLVPQVLYMNEKRAHQFDIGLMSYYKIKDTDYDMVLGLDYRHKDAVVIHAGIKQNEHIFRFSYDINTSYLNNYSGGKGAWEFSLLLTGEKGKPLFSKF